MAAGRVEPDTDAIPYLRSGPLAIPTKSLHTRVHGAQASFAFVLVLLAEMGPLAASQPRPAAPALPAVPVLATTPPIKVAVATAAPTKRPQVVRKAPPEPSSGRCGGDLPTCGVMMCESKGNLTAANRSSSARGKWQITSGTWNNYGGYSSADQAPEHVQDAKARELWAGGAGRGHWRACL